MNKRLISFIVVFAVFLASSVCYGSSDEFSTYIMYEPGTNSLEISGVAYKSVTVSVFDASLDIESLSDSEPPMLIKVLNPYGSFKYSVTMPDSAEAGAYTVYVVSDGVSITEKYLMVNSETAREAVEMINNASTVSQVESILLERALDLGIDADSEVFVSKLNLIASMVIKKDYSDYSSFYRSYTEFSAVASMSDADPATVEGLLKKYDSILGIDFDSDIIKDSRLTLSQIDSLYTLLAQTDFASQYPYEYENGFNRFSGLLERLKVMLLINEASNWATYKNIITEDFKESFEDLLSDSKYQNLDYKDRVFEFMTKNTYESFEDIINGLELSIDEAWEVENTKSSGGFGGSGGSRGSSGVFSNAVSVPKDTMEQTAPKLVQFKDVPENFWGYDAVYSLADRGMLTGYEDMTFKPDSSVTRAEFAKMIVNVSEGMLTKEPEQQFNTVFDDVNKESWFYDCVTNAATLGIVNGYDEKFLPDASIKREDAALMVYRALVLTSVKLKGNKKFPDSEEISEYASKQVAALAAMGIVSGGADNKFAPKSNITRAEAAQLLYNAFFKQ